MTDTLEKAADVGGIAGDQLRTIVQRIERLNEEADAIKTDTKAVFEEAKSVGYDVKALRQIIRLRKKDRQEREEEAQIVELYMAALGEN